MYNYPTYQPYMLQQQTPQQNNGIIWIQGEAAAKSYLVAPNTSVPLWDSERQTIYIKSADQAGIPSMKIIDYTIREPQAPAAAEAAYASRDDLEAVRAQLANIQDEINKMRRSSDE